MLLTIYSFIHLQDYSSLSLRSKKGIFLRADAILFAGRHIIGILIKLLSSLTHTMSGPVTPSSDSPQIHDARPSRPFSPSPPRDNMHTASRPASFFLGTAVPASPSVSDSRSFNILGLPPTPQAQKTEFYDGLPRHEMPEDIFGQGGAGPKSRKASRVGQPGEVDRTTVTAELAAGRDSLSLVRSMRYVSLLN